MSSEGATPSSPTTDTESQQSFSSVNSRSSSPLSQISSGEPREEGAYDKLKRIIDQTTIRDFTYPNGGPNKVDTNLNNDAINPTTNFVVATYWWGRGNDNGNTARPCVSFFEEMVKDITKYAVKMITSLYKNKVAITGEKDLEDYMNRMTEFSEFNNIVKKYTKIYMGMVYEFLQIPLCKLQKYENVKDPEQNARIKSYNTAIDNLNRSYAEELIQKIKVDGFSSGMLSIHEGRKISQQFKYKTQEETEKDIREIFIKMIDLAKEDTISIANVRQQLDALKKLYDATYRPPLGPNAQKGTVALPEQSAQLKPLFLETTKRINELKKQYTAAIITKLKEKKKTYQLFSISYNYHHHVQIESLNGREPKPDDGSFAGYNIYDILNERFRFIEPLKFEEMIAKWGRECQKYGCYYLSVEYPEFAGQGGYQMAINAKPLFIKKALQLVKGEKLEKNLGVLYIDGDMYIRHYPHIFDMPNVDFMARGWWIDPRSSYKMDESITYDPYTFETSGGTMFFSQSIESKSLIDAWIDASNKVYQAGKADDRILSLIFNTQKWLLTANVIQLPIEYLWLTLDYDDRLKERLYDWNEEKMRETIFIEHPECLTSEETAGGAGASSDRSPKFYKFLDLDEARIPVTELFYEYLMFDDDTSHEKIKDAFKTYFDYMSNVYYIDDENEQLVTRKLINQDDPDLNEQPLYIFPYENSYATRNAIAEKNKTILNGVEELNNTAVDSGSFVEKKFNLQTDETIGHHIEKYTRESGGNESIDINIFKIVKLGPVDEAPLVAGQGPKVLGEEYEIPIIISLLSKGFSVIYSHNTTLNEDDVNKALRKYTNTGLELIFFPKMSEMEHNLKPIIDLTKPIIFRTFEGPSRNMMIKILSMFSSLEDFSEYLSRGSYQIMSRIRIGYVFSSKSQAPCLTGSKDTSESGAGGKSTFGGGGNQIGGMNRDDEDIYKTLGIEKPTKLTPQKTKTKQDPAEFQKAYEESFCKYLSFKDEPLRKEEGTPVADADADGKGGMRRKKQTIRGKKKYNKRTRRH